MCDSLLICQNRVSAKEISFVHFLENCIRSDMPVVLCFISKGPCTILVISASPQGAFSHEISSEDWVAQRSRFPTSEIW